MILAAQAPDAIERFTPLAKHLARRWTGTAVPLGVRVEATCRGLERTAARLDPDGPRFASAAVAEMVRELRRVAPRPTSWPPVGPAPAVTLAGERLWQHLGRAPTAAELAASTGMDLEDVVGLRAS
jgi:RNA polymerase sigma-B factor